MPVTTSQDDQRARDQLAANAIRALTMDATQASGDGHPGMPMGAAPMGWALYRHAMRHDPQVPDWWNRDRYVQSAGHGSMLQYSLLQSALLPVSQPLHTRKDLPHPHVTPLPPPVLA
jgi:transketolase